MLSWLRRALARIGCALWGSAEPEPVALGVETVSPSEWDRFAAAIAPPHDPRSHL